MASPHLSSAADLDGDGDMDIDGAEVVQRSILNGNLIILGSIRTDINGDIDEEVEHPTRADGSRSWSVIATDIDGDGNNSGYRP